MLLINVLDTPQYFEEFFAVWTNRLVATIIAVPRQKKGNFMCWADPGWMPGPHQSCSSTLLLRWTGERNDSERSVGQDEDRERALAHYRPGQNNLDLENLIYYQSNPRRAIRNKNLSIKTLSPNYSLLPGLNFTPVFLCLLPPSGAGG